MIRAFSLAVIAAVGLAGCAATSDWRTDHDPLCAAETADWRLADVEVTAPATLTTSEQTAIPPIAISSGMARPKATATPGSRPSSRKGSVSALPVCGDPGR